MKKVMLLLLVILAVAPVTSSALGFLNITDAQLTRLDETTYRLRVTYDWGGVIESGATINSGLGGLLIPPMAGTFGMTGGGTGFNMFNQQAASELVHSGTDLVYQRVGNQYGYDFTASDPLVSSMNFLWQGQLMWISPVTNGFLQSTYIAATENYNGQLLLPTDPSSVPEPASVLLLGLGLTGIVFFRRRK